MTTSLPDPLEDALTPIQEGETPHNGKSRAVTHGRAQTSGAIRTTIASTQEIAEHGEHMEAREFFTGYLSENVQTVKIMKEMDEIIREFKSCAPVMFVWKCIDGRVHGSKGKGYPIGTIQFGRTEGAKIDIDSKNIRLWEIINASIADAEQKTPGMPAVMISLGHYAKSDPHRSCAAHGCDNAKALATVEGQTRKLREEYYNPENIEPYTRDQVVFIHGMTNTDDMSETLIFEHGEKIDSGDLIDELGLSHPSNVFSTQFLDEPIHDPTTRKHVGPISVQTLLEGTEAPMYQELRTALAMETFLMRRISEIVNKNGRGAEEILNKKVFDHLYKKLKGIKDLPSSLVGPLLYQFVWNIAYALYQRSRLEGMPEAEQKKHLDHAEDLVCYGEGFETLSRNKTCLVKPGRGDELAALTTAKKVLLTYSPLKELPMVHINIELTDKIGSWDSYRLNVLAKLRRMKDNMNKIFGKNVHVLCTYSYKNEKKFYPIIANSRDQRECAEQNVIAPFTSETHFSPENFSHVEFDYTQGMLQHAKMRP